MNKFRSCHLRSRDCMTFMIGPPFQPKQIVQREDTQATQMSSHGEKKKCRKLGLNIMLSTLLVCRKVCRKPHGIIPCVWKQCFWGSS